MKVLPVKDRPGYFISSTGIVFSEKVKRLGRVQLSPGMVNGYLVAHLYVNGVRHVHSVHTLVLETFKGPRPLPYYQARHRNGIPTDNRISNLKWGTPKQNAADKKKHGTHLVGEDCGPAKLSERQVIKILCRLSKGEHWKEIAKSYKCGWKNIWEIYTRRSWTHLVRPDQKEPITLYEGSMRIVDSSFGRLSIADTAKASGLAKSTVRHRLKRGISLLDPINEQMQRNRKR